MKRDLVLTNTPRWQLVNELEDILTYRMDIEAELRRRGPTDILYYGYTAYGGLMKVFKKYGEAYDEVVRDFPDDPDAGYRITSIYINEGALVYE